MPTYHVWTVGCQMNKADSDRLGVLLERLGYAEEDNIRDADLVVLNSCSVRQSAEDRVAGMLGSLKALKRAHPERMIALMGCMVDGDTTPLRKRFPYVDVFMRPQAFDGLLDLLRESGVRGRGPGVGGRESGTGNPELGACSEGAERAAAYGSLAPGPQPPSVFVPIIHGCNHVCSYCIVPYRRGKERSRSVDEIVCEVEGLVRRGAKEVTLLGQNVDAYGHDLPEKPDLADLLAVVNGVEGLARIRFLTSHPKYMTQKLIDSVAALDKVCEHVNLPVQAGDDEILRAMRRGYTADEYRDLAGRIRQTVPAASLSTDIIVGFPGETAAQFDATYALLEDLRFDKVHVAAYSPRPGTVAARLPDDVPAEEKRRRLQAVEALQERISGEANAALLGREVEILVEERVRGKWSGRTRTNKLVFFPDEADRRGQLVSVLVEKAGPWSLQGNLLGG